MFIIYFNFYLFFVVSDIPAQVPPLTPGTNKKMTEALKASFASWEKEQLKLNIVKGKSELWLLIWCHTCKLCHWRFVERIILSSLEAFASWHSRKRCFGTFSCSGWFHFNSNEPCPLVKFMYLKIILMGLGLASWVGSILDVKCQTFSQASSLGFPAVLCCHGQTVSPAPFLSVSMNYLSWR